ncbi:MAG: DNA mismatch repair endonuclease MutL [Nitrospinota bacterium]
MERRIQVMPPPLANQIAAGEVVERPASVAKELIENALDAGAKFIEAEIAGGGMKRVLVADDGEGIFPDDARLAFQRHATSKIRRAEDLHSLMTLGFRGEALPSIASVARVTLITRRRAAAEGTPAGKTHPGVKVVVEGGKEVEVRQAPAPPGTAVEVRNLFYNTPARMKFVKSQNTELARIVEVTTNAALARPGVGFKLRSEKKSLLDLPPADREGRVRALLPEREAKGLFPFSAAEGGGGGVRVEGMASLPSVTRAGRSCQHVMINGRHVRDRVVLSAANDVYRGLIPSGRHPLFFLFLTMDAADVDVNVHPAKAEVRFRDGGRVFAAVRRALAEGLIRACGVSDSSLTGVVDRKPGEANAPEKAGSGATSSAAKIYPLRPTERPDAGRPEPPGGWGFTLPGRKAGGRKGAPGRSAALAAQAPDSDRVPLLEAAAPKGLLSDVRVLGQIHGTFVLLEHPSGLLVMDPHAAHERVLFTRLREYFEAGNIERQALLIPVDVEVSPAEAVLLSEHLGDLDRLGLGIEPFGPSSFVVREVPALLSHVDPAGLVREVVEGLGDAGKRRKEFTDLAGRIIDRMACRGAVKAGDGMKREEIERLVKECLELDLLFTCPHGRPITLVLPREEMERRFLRR